MSSMRRIRLTAAVRSSPTPREKRLKFCGLLEPMTRWRRWLTVTHLSGKCTRTRGILFPVSFPSGSIPITISECHSPGSSTKWTAESTTWWLTIRCTSPKTRGHSRHPRTLTVPKTCGAPRRTCLRRTRCVTLTGTPKTPTTTFMARTISTDLKTARPSENTTLTDPVLPLLFKILL